MNTPADPGGTPTTGRHVIDGDPGLAGSGREHTRSGPEELELHDLDLAPGAADVVLHQERLTISTQRVGVERVRISKRIVTTTRTIEVPVRVEQLVITHEPFQQQDREQLQAPRQPVNGEEDLATLPGRNPSTTTGDDLVIVLHEEVPVVTLRVVPVERVVVSKRSVIGEETLTVDLAAEAAEVTMTDVAASGVTT